MGTDLRLEDIDIVHRFKKGNRQPNPIIVRFNNYYSKDKMYRGTGKYARQMFDTFQIQKKFT